MLVIVVLADYNLNLMLAILWKSLKELSIKRGWGGYAEEIS